MAKSSVNIHQDEPPASTPIDSSTDFKLQGLSDNKAELTVALNTLADEITAAINDKNMQSRELPNNKAAIQGSSLVPRNVEVLGFDSAVTSLNALLGPLNTITIRQTFQAVSLSSNVPSISAISKFEDDKMDLIAQRLSKESGVLGELLGVVNGLRLKVSTL